MRFAEILANFPNRFVALILKFVIQPFGARGLGPSDRVSASVRAAGAGAVGRRATG